jgi:hypothetical protein
VARRGTTSYIVTVSSVNGFTGNVNLTLSGLPSGATAAFNPAVVSGGSGTSKLTITVGNSRGKYTLTITGMSGGLSHSAAVQLTVSK